MLMSINPFASYSIAKYISPLNVIRPDYEMLTSEKVLTIIEYMNICSYIQCKRMYAC